MSPRIVSLIPEKPSLPVPEMKTCEAPDCKKTSYEVQTRRANWHNKWEYDKDLCRDCWKKQTSSRYIEHGGGTQGRKGCGCPLCKSKRAEYDRNRKLKLPTETKDK